MMMAYKFFDEAKRILAEVATDSSLHHGALDQVQEDMRGRRGASSSSSIETAEQVSAEMATDSSSHRSAAE